MPVLCSCHHALHTLQLPVGHDLHLQSVQLLRSCPGAAVEKVLPPWRPGAGHQSLAACPAPDVARRQRCGCVLSCPICFRPAQRKMCLGSVKVYTTGSFGLLEAYADAARSSSCAMSNCADTPLLASVQLSVGWMASWQWARANVTSSGDLSGKGSISHDLPAVQKGSFTCQEGWL